MRMWMIDPKLLCNKHLTGEHVECHMLVGCINRGMSLDGYVRNGLIEPHNIKRRHDSLEREMLSRGMNANSPLSKFEARRSGSVSKAANINELSRRCLECKKRFEKHNKGGARWE